MYVVIPDACLTQQPPDSTVSHWTWPDIKRKSLRLFGLVSSECWRTYQCDDPSRKVRVASVRYAAGDWQFAPAGRRVDHELCDNRPADE